jgi:ketosteroid isomerase-like protein
MAEDPLTVVAAWAQAYSRRDLDAMLALSCPDIEVARRLRHEHGHDAVRGPLHRQSFGVEMHPRVRCMFHRGDTVMVDAQLVVSYVDTGEPVEEQEAAAILVVRDGCVARYVPYPDLDTALSDAGLGEDDEVR